MVGVPTELKRGRSCLFFRLRFQPKGWIWLHKICLEKEHFIFERLYRGLQEPKSFQHEQNFVTIYETNDSGHQCCGAAAAGSRPLFGWTPNWAAPAPSVENQQSWSSILFTSTLFT